MTTSKTITIDCDDLIAGRDIHLDPNLVIEFTPEVVQAVRNRANTLREDLREQLQKCQNEVAAKRINIDNLRKQIEAKDFAIQSLQKGVVALKALLRGKDATIESLRAEIARLEVQNKSLRNQLRPYQA